ncbi:MAG TPA: ribosome silencing factor [Granulicella sp.]|nr:ribosome silencing factor [Granulicella sp.]
MASIESYKLVLAAAAACEDKKAEDIRILALDPAESGLSDYFLICNGTNERQNVAITDEIEIRLKREFGLYPNSVEGRRQGEWILMDYVDFIVHVFSPEKRAFYGLERLRKSAKTLSIDDLNAEMKALITSTRAKIPSAAKSAAKAAAKKAASPAAKATPKAPAKKTVAKKTATKAAKGVKAAAKTVTKTAAKSTKLAPVVSKASSKKAATKKVATKAVGVKKTAAKKTVAKKATSPLRKPVKTARSK